MVGWLVSGLVDGSEGFLFLFFWFGLFGLIWVGSWFGFNLVWFDLVCFVWFCLVWFGFGLVRVEFGFLALVGR